MKNMSIEEIPIIPEEYGADTYNRIDWTSIHSEMSDGQRRFINGMIRYYKPESILELGVSAGGGTVCLLNAMEDYESVLYSIDNGTQFYRKPELPVGYCAIERYPDLLNNKWHLLTGKDPASVMEKINRRFDFCVIDTLHLHPVEVLNFISVLPWLNEGAIVVMHDTSLFECRTELTFMRMHAPRLLLSAVCAKKYIPYLPSEDMTASNLAAWQVSEDTFKYCQNLFDILHFPWEVSILPSAYESICTLVKKHYPEKMLGYLKEAVRINKSLFLAKEFEVLSFERLYDNLGEDTIFYGAGAKAHELLALLAENEMKFCFPIWDKKAGEIKEVMGHRVTEPVFYAASRQGQIMIITIENEKTAGEVRRQFEPLGYTVFHGLKEYMLSC